MSETIVHSCFQENLSKPAYSGSQLDQKEAESLVKPEPTEPIHSAFFDLKTKRLILNDEGMMSGDAKPPSRFSQNLSEKTPEDLLRDINEKLQLNAVRRARFLDDVVQKSRRYIEKTQCVKERLTRRQTETCQSTLTTLNSKRQTADKMRERLLQYKVERIRKRLEHVTIVRQKKITNSTNSSKHASTNSTEFKQSTKEVQIPTDITSSQPQSPSPNETQTS